MNDEIRHISVRQGYDLWAESYDRTPNPVVLMDARHSARVLSPEAGELILDAGCGTGRNMEGLLGAGARVVGIDFSAGMLEVARRTRPEASLAVADLQALLPFVDACFDAALCALVGEHLADLLLTLSELRRVLKPGGRLVFSVYHPAMAAAGAEANFRDAGIEYHLGALRHAVDDYLNAVVDAGFDAIAYREYRGDQRLADELPSAAKYVGAPVLLLIAATTAG